MDRNRYENRYYYDVQNRNNHSSSSRKYQIAFFCVLFIIVGAAIQFSMIRASYLRAQKLAAEKSAESDLALDLLRIESGALTNEERADRMMKSGVKDAFKRFQESK